MLTSNATRSQRPRLLDEVRKVLRLHHYSSHTERAYVEWIVRFVRFHGMRFRKDLLFQKRPYKKRNNFRAGHSPVDIRRLMGMAPYHWPKGLIRHNRSTTRLATRFL